MTERELAPNAARRLAILQHAEEVTGNVAKTCRYYGISRQQFYTYKRRYDAEGVDGLRDRVHALARQSQAENRNVGEIAAGVVARVNPNGATPDRRCHT